MCRLPVLAAIAALALLAAGCGGGGDAAESLAGTPAAIHIVRDVEGMARACKQPGPQSRRAGIRAYADLARITAAHPDATFGPEDTEVTMRALLRRSVERAGHCIGVRVDSRGRYHVGRDGSGR